MSVVKLGVTRITSKVRSERRGRYARRSPLTLRSGGVNGSYASESFRGTSRKCKPGPCKPLRAVRESLPLWCPIHPESRTPTPSG